MSNGQITGGYIFDKCAMLLPTGTFWWDVADNAVNSSGWWSWLNVLPSPAQPHAPLRGCSGGHVSRARRRLVLRGTHWNIVELVPAVVASRSSARCAAGLRGRTGKAEKGTVWSSWALSDPSNSINPYEVHESQHRATPYLYPQLMLCIAMTLPCTAHAAMCLSPASRSESHWSRTLPPALTRNRLVECFVAASILVLE